MKCPCLKRRAISFLDLSFLLRGSVLLEDASRKKVYFSLDSLETVSLLRPFFLRAFTIFLPFFVAILERNPCLLTLFLLEG
jgi:hypothetical protein